MLVYLIVHSFAQKRFLAYKQVTTCARLNYVIQNKKIAKRRTLTAIFRLQDLVDYIIIVLQGVKALPKIKIKEFFVVFGVRLFVIIVIKYIGEAERGGNYIFGIFKF